MEDVLEVYQRPRDPAPPLVCLDECTKPLLADTRNPLPMTSRHPARVDYEYQHNGTANLFMVFTPLEGRWHLNVTDRRTAIDYAHLLKDIADNLLSGLERLLWCKTTLTRINLRPWTKRFRPPKRGGWLNALNGITCPNTIAG